MNRGKAQADAPQVVVFPRLGHTTTMIGSVIGEHIRILGALGQGGMGEVYLGVDERLGRKVAVKTIRSDRSDAARERFLREARALSALDHPNICRIFEYIKAPEGEFLVLELIEGVTLGRAIERGMSRGRKLRVAAAILEALVAAHRKGIVHYDIKPDNVMIAADGTVKVLDFGIAHLESSGLQPPASAREIELAEDAATAIYRIDGVTQPLRPTAVIAGTPLYMSPEQAVGGEITPASDLYSFGLLLQTLLTEEPPHPMGLTRELLLEQAARGESLPMKGEARDVTALIASLKDPSPMKRPTATEALAAIHRILDKPKRRIRMLTAVLAVVLLLAGAAKYALDIMAARKEAERRRNQAESLVRFIVGDLRQKLESVGRLDVLDDAASRALAYFESLRPEEMTGQDLNDNALALTQLGRAREQQGNLGEAIALFRQSKRFAEAAAARDGSREDWQLTLSSASFFLGDTLRREGHTAEALRNFQTYSAISRSLAQKHPGDAKYQAEVSYAHGNLGAVHEASGDLSRALEEYRISLEMDRRRLRGDPANESWQGDVANSANRLGVVLQKMGDFTGARNAFAEDLQLRRSLFRAVPNDVRRRRRLAVSLAWAGQLHFATGDRDAAIACYREETELTKELAESDPTNSSAKRNWSVARARLAELLPPAEGLPLADAAARDLRSLVESDSRTMWRRDLAGALMRVGMLRAQTGDRDIARSATGEALALGEDLVAAQPSDTSSIRILAETLLHLARLDEREGQTAAAQSRRERVLAVTARSASDPFVAAARARALAALGRGSEAAALENKLIAGGYREAELVAATAAPRASPSTPP